MREGWNRGEAAVEADAATIALLLKDVLPGATLVAVEATSGGLANTNFKISLNAETGRRDVLLRYWQRDPKQAGKEVALLDLVNPMIPAPRILSFGDADPNFGLPFAVLEWIDGQRLETIAPELTGDALSDLGWSIGSTLAAIHNVSFDQQGFFDARLVVDAAVDFGRDGLLHWLRKCLHEGRGGDRLGAGLTAELMAFVERRGHVLNNAWATRSCLTHGDFNGSNILLRSDARRSSWAVAAVLDWEFAFAGGPAFDFGNLLRPPLGLAPGFVNGVIAGYLAAGGELPDEWQAASLMADLYSWADFLNLPKAEDSLVEDARQMVRQTINSGICNTGI